MYSSHSFNKTHNYSSSIYSSSPSVHSPAGTSSSPLPDSSSPSTGFMHSPSSVCYSQYPSSYSNMSTSAHVQQSLSSSLKLAVSDTLAVTSTIQSSHHMSYSYQSKPAPYAISAPSSSLTQNSHPAPCIPPLHTSFYTRSPPPTLSGHSPHSTLHSHSSHSSSYIHSSRSVLYAQSHQPPSYAQSPQPASYAESPQPTSYTQSPHPASYAQSPQPASYSQSPQPPSYTQSSYPASYTQSHQSALYTQSSQPTSYTESHQSLICTQSPQPTSYAHSHHSPSYIQSPQPALYSHSPQATSYIQSRHPNSHIQSKHPTSYSLSPQPLAYSIPTQRCVNDDAPHSPHALSFQGGRISSYCQPPQPDSYCQSPKTTPIPAEVSPTNNVVKDDSQSPILPPYSNPEISPSSSHYFPNPASISYSSIYSSQQTNDNHDSHSYSTSKGLVLAPSSYPAGEMSSSFLSLERSLSPPSYEAHLQNSSSYLTSDHHLSNPQYDVPVTHQQTTPTNYSVSCHSSRLEQEDSAMHLDPRKNIRSPPAYPTSTALFPPPPPPRYTSNPKITPTGCHSKYAVAPDMSEESFKDESSHAYFTNTPPMVPPPAAPPSVDIQSDTPHCSMQNCNTSQSHSSSHSCASSLSFPSGIYFSSQDGQCNCDDQEELQGSHNRSCKSMDQQVLYKHYLEETDLSVPVCRTSKRGGGIHSNENLKVHSIIERAERLWFIPQQEQNRVYMKRKELARDFLSHPNLHSSRNMMLKEKFWIEEDEPIAEEILLSSLTSNPESEQQQQKEGNARELSAVAVNDSQERGDVTGGPKSKRKQIREMLCQVCGKMLKGCRSLRSHLNSHHNIQPHACPYCSKSFTNRSVLVVHLRIHTGEMPFICNICDTSFRTRSGLMRHKSMHTNVRPYECSMCSKAFKTKLVLQQHLKLHLTGVFTCSDCGKTFERHKSLAVHKASHHYKSQRFPCPQCHKEYHFRSLLNHHMQIHSNIRKHVCPVCNEAFVWQSGLAAHKKTHSTSRPQCDICGVRFASKKRLETHYRRHSDPQPHKCRICNRSFSHAYRLASHSLTHQEHKEYVCPKCSILFSSAKKLRKHLATSHRKEESRICQLSGTVEIAKSSS